MAARGITVINSTPSGNKLVGILYRTGMKSVSKFNGTSVVKSQLFKLVECMFCVTSSTNAQENGVESHNFCTNEFAEVCMLPLYRLQLLSRPRVLTVLGVKNGPRVELWALLGSSPAPICCPICVIVGVLGSIHQQHDCKKDGVITTVVGEACSLSLFLSVEIRSSLEGVHSPKGQFWLSSFKRLPE
eukprot:1137708-Pelagomonas_calceolata.AAC.2